MKKIKKISLISITCILIILIVFFIVENVLKNKYKKEFSLDAQNQNRLNVINYMITVVENMSVNEKAGIAPDTQLKEELITTAKELVEIYDPDTSLCRNFQFLYICDYFNLEYADELKNCIMDSYMEEFDMFADGKDSRLGVNAHELYDMHVSTTVSVAKDLYKYVSKNDYDIVEKCVSIYNEYIYKLEEYDSHSDEYLAIEGIILDVFWFLYSIDKHDRIDCELLKSPMQKYIDECRKELLSENYNIDTVSSVSILYDMCNALELDNVEFGLDQSIYESMNTEESFGVEKNVSDNFISICFAIKEIEDPSKNEFYVNNVNKWQRQYCEEFVFISEE